MPSFVSTTSACPSMVTARDPIKVYKACLLAPPHHGEGRDPSPASLARRIACARSAT